MSAAKQIPTEAQQAAPSGAEAPRPVLRNEKGQLVKGGANLNPAGRPRNAIRHVAQLIRDQTKDGATLVEFLQNVVDGNVKATTRDRLEAARMLMDRSLGRSVETVLTGELGEEERAAAASLTTDQLESLANALKPEDKG